MRVFLDTNVILDYLLKRQPFYEDSKKVFERCLWKLEGCISPHSLIDIFYMLSEHTDKGVEYCRNTILKLRTVLAVVPEDDDRVYSAAKNDAFADFEDSMQAECAITANADYIITRNEKDFTGSKIPIVTPAEFLALMESASQ